jgi:PAT family beta-lactamase induction signal transducer AmpG
VDLAQTTRGRLALFGALYFAQGVPFGFVTGALILRLTSQGMGPADVAAITATVYGPWTFKFLLAPLVDSLAGRQVRRALLLASEALMAISAIAVAFVDPHHRWLFLTLIFVNSGATSLQDVLTDAVAIAVLPEHERGKANGVMSAAKIAGGLVGGIGLGALMDHVGWTVTPFLAVALLLVPVVVVARLAEPPGVPRPVGPALRAMAHELRVAFLRRTTALAALFVLVAGASDNFLAPLVVSRLRMGMGLSNTQMALLGIVPSLVNGLGALVGGWLSDRVGRRAVILTGAVALAAAHLTFALVTRTTPALVAYLIATGLAGGVLYATTIALCMDLTDPRLAATHFQVFMALFSVRSIWAAKVGGRLAEQMSPAMMFLMAAAIELAPLALLPFIASRRGKALSSRS